MNATNILQKVLDKISNMTVDEYNILYDEAEKKFAEFETANAEKVLKDHAL